VHEGGSRLHPRLRGISVVIAIALAGVACSAEPSSDAGPARPRLLEVEGEGTPLQPGTYTFSPFEPRVTFELTTEGFEGGHTHPYFFDIWNGQDSALGFAVPGFLIGTGPKHVDVDGMSNEDVLEMLADNPEFHEVAASTMTVGQRSISSIEAVGGREQAPIFGNSEGTYNMSKNVRYRIASLEIGSTIVLVLQVALEPPYRPALAKMEPVLETVDFPSS